MSFKDECLADNKILLKLIIFDITDISSKCESRNANIFMKTN